MIEWLKSQHDWSVERLCDYIETTYGVVFQSRQSYCQLLADADIIYKQAQRINPKFDFIHVRLHKRACLSGAQTAPWELSQRRSSHLTSKKC